MMPEMQQTDSKAFSQHGYDEQNQELYITFRSSGATWIYPMPKDEYDKMTSGSLGSFFHSNVDKKKGRRA